MIFHKAWQICNFLYMAYGQCIASPKLFRSQLYQCMQRCSHTTQPIIQYTSPLPTLLESSCGPLPRAEPFCLPSACPGRSEAILSRQNAGSCVRDHVCSVWDCEKVSKLGKSWKREPFWPRLREKAAAAPRSPSLFSPPANENPAFFSAYLCHFTKTKTFKALLLAYFVSLYCDAVVWPRTT